VFALGERLLVLAQVAQPALVPHMAEVAGQKLPYEVSPHIRRPGLLKQIHLAVPGERACGKAVSLCVNMCFVMFSADLKWSSAVLNQLQACAAASDTIMDAKDCLPWCHCMAGHFP